jgi:5-methylcytosine-specific restriction endonuclease McrA
MDQAETLGSRGRTPIPDDVKVFVWQRDSGRCVRCGSNERLEFDHIIPVSLGGANTARNLQVLCEPCNRSKGAAIA